MVIKIPSWLSRSLDQAGAELIENAVKNAEKRTAGEIVPLIVRGSTVNSSAPLLAIFILGFIVLGFKHGFWVYDLSQYTCAYLWMLLFALAVPLGLFFGRSHFGQMLLTANWEKKRQVQQRALLEFYEAHLNQTKGQTGILLFVSWRERQAVVLADEGIAKHCQPEVFKEVVDALVQGAKAKKLSEGYARAIALSADILAKHIPIKADDKNELKDHLRIID